MKREVHATGRWSLLLVNAVALAAGCGSKTGNTAVNLGTGGSAGGGQAGADAGDQAGADAGGQTGADGGDQTGSDAGNGPPTTLYLVGDSTVSGFNDPYYYPRYGYGTQIGTYLGKNVTVTNLALSGRSSKSFINPADNGNYAILTSSIKAGDYLMIGFGHNDEKADETMYTNPNTDVTDPTSFKYYLSKYYVQVAQAAGATPILTTPVVRRDAAGAYGGAKAHVTTDVVIGTVTYPGGDYPQAIRDLGAALGVTVIDNTASTMALGKQIFAASGAAGTANLQAWVSSAPTSVDDTHTNIYGASYYAYLIASALKTSTSPLKDYVLPGIAPPDLAILVVNPNWKPIVYSPPVKGSLWTTTDPWLGAVFGDIGGATKTSDGSFSISETSSAPLTVSMRSGTAATPAGKIAAATDGIAFYFQQIPIDKDFRLSATATVTSIAYSNSQVGFGLMVRDAAWMDISDASLLSSYVAAGVLKGNAPATAWSSFIRDTGAATQLTGTVISSADAVPQAGWVLDISITKVGALYTSKFGMEAPHTYTIDLNAVDDQFVYAGLFTSRMCQVEFSNISLVISD